MDPVTHDAGYSNLVASLREISSPHPHEDHSAPNSHNGSHMNMCVYVYSLYKYMYV